MKDKTFFGGISVLVIGVVVIGAVWLIFLRPSDTPSLPLQAIPVQVDDPDNSFVFFEILPSKSAVTFTLEEEFRGLPTTVVGRSQVVAGQIAVNFNNLAASQLGPIIINARTLNTNNDFRNNAIHSFILDTETHDLIVFTPVLISGWPTRFSSGDSVSLQISGELTIREWTKNVTFSTAVTAHNFSQLSGSATAQIQRSDFNLTIPEAPGIANVGETVTLTIDFIAKQIDITK